MKLRVETGVQIHIRESSVLCFIMKFAIQNSLKNCTLFQQLTKEGNPPWYWRIAILNIVSVIQLFCYYERCYMND